MNPNGEERRDLEQSLEFGHSAASPQLPLPMITPDTKSADPPGSEDTSCNYDGRGAVGAARGGGLRPFPHSDLGRADSSGSRSTRANQRTAFAVFFSLTAAYRRVAWLPPQPPKLFRAGTWRAGCVRRLNFISLIASRLFRSRINPRQPVWCLSSSLFKEKGRFPAAVGFVRVD